MSSSLTLSFYFTLLLLLLIPRALADVYSCGGFVKSSNIRIDYGKIQVKLLTVEGNLKYETECNPSNGYYLIPVYNKAAYSIRVFAPDGWYFEPSFVDVKVDGKSDPCTLNEDINFVLTSFAVEGVLKSGEGGGPSGVALTLSTLDGKIVATTKTEKNGIYTFRAPPGKYMVSTGDGSAQCIERSIVPVEVVSGAVRVAPDLKISGHLLTVKAVSGVRPLAAVLISLFSDIDVQLPYCNGDEKLLRGSRKMICSLKTSDIGAVKFPCLPPGTYEVVPSLSTEKTRFTFSPKAFRLEMRSAPETVSFDMLGFNGRGRVLIGEVPIKDAEILLNGQEKGKTDINGWYILEELQEKEYTISARKEHYQFDVMKIALTAELPNIPDLIAKKVELCGFLDVEKSKNPVTTVFITNKRTNDPQSIRSNTNGKFCKMVEPDIYMISPSKENGVLMMPKQREADLTKGPIVDLVFTQFKANILVKASCIAVCDELKMELWNEKELVKSLIGTEEFRFTSISPDTYRVKVVDGGRYCWEQSEIKFTVERSHIDDVSFRQKGYRGTVRVSHPAKMKWLLVENKQLAGEMSIPAGVTSFCVPVAGRYSLKFDACYIFDKAVYEMIIPQESPLVISASHFLVTTLLVSASDTAKEADFALSVKDSSTTTTVQASLTSLPNNFNFKFYLPLGDSGRKITLLPQSALYLFEPYSHEFFFNGECHENVVVFKAVKGVFIEGSLLSPVAGVKIQAKHRSIDDYVLSTFTDLNGSYRLGPVRVLEDFEITAEREGYKFEESEKKGIFIPIKLSQLRISLVDAVSGQPLNDVLLSLSGVQNYRSNNIIDKTGKIAFVGLHPGEYFVRPILQEYRFEPPSLTINVKEGKEESVTLKGRQFAYSLFGSVTYMAGQPVEGVVVEAVAERCNQLQEEDVTSDKGTYRVRGLRPQCVYRLTLKSQARKNIRSYPTYYDLSVADKHIEDIDFVVINVEKPMDVIGEVDFVGVKPPSQYRVALFRRDSLVARNTVHAPSCIFFFDGLSVDGTEYTVRFETESGNSGEILVSSEVSFIANSTCKTIKLQVFSQAFSFAEDALSRLSAYSARHQSPSPVDESSDSVRRRTRSRKI